MKLSIRYKLLLSFFTLVLLLLPGIFYTLQSLDYIKKAFSEITEQSYPRIQALFEMQNVSTKIHEAISSFNAENIDSPMKIADQKNTLLAYLEDIYAWQKEYQKTLSNKQDSALDIGKLSQLRDTVILTALSAFSGKENRMDGAQLLIKKQALDRAEDNLDLFIKRSIKKETAWIASVKKNTLTTANKLYDISLIMILTVIFLAIIISLFLAHKIAFPIIQLTNFSKGISESNLNKKAPILTNDEVGELTVSLNTMLDDLYKARILLIEVSRKSGAAEVASGVLHNLGNILNSINISTGVTIELVTSLELDKIEKILECLREHESDLNHYIKNDAQENF